MILTLVLILAGTDANSGDDAYKIKDCTASTKGMVAAIHPSLASFEKEEAKFYI